MSVSNLLAQEHASSEKRHILNFSGGGARHKAVNVFVEKYVLILGFLAYLEVKVLGKVLI